MKTSCASAFLFFLATTIVLVAGSQPPAPPSFPSTGSSNGTAYMRFGGQWMTFPYVVYNDYATKSHIDFITTPYGPMMLGAYVNSTAYVTSPTGSCLGFTGEQFPFPPDLMLVNNATWIGTEWIEQAGEKKQVDHWSLVIPTMGSFWPTDLYVDENENVIRSVFIGGGEARTSVVFDLLTFDPNPPPPSVFAVPPQCKTTSTM